jgi:hypothetical protein
LIYAYGEPLSFSDLLFILDFYFKSEESYYPKPKYLGSTMLMTAILHIYSGIPLKRVLKDFKLTRKGKGTIIIERTEKETTSVEPIEKLHEVLESTQNHMNASDSKIL